MIEKQSTKQIRWRDLWCGFHWCNERSTKHESLYVVCDDLLSLCVGGSYWKVNKPLYLYFPSKRSSLLSWGSRQIYTLSPVYFIQWIFVECALCTRHCFSQWRCSSEKKGMQGISALSGDWILMSKRGYNQNNIYIHTHTHTHTHIYNITVYIILNI